MWLIETTMPMTYHIRDLNTIRMDFEEREHAPQKRMLLYDEHIAVRTHPAYQPRGLQGVFRPSCFHEGEKTNEKKIII